MICNDPGSRLSRRLLPKHGTLQEGLVLEDVSIFCIPFLDGTRRNEN